MPMPSVNGGMSGIATSTIRSVLLTVVEWTIAPRSEATFGCGTQSKTSKTPWPLNFIHDVGQTKIANKTKKSEGIENDVPNESESCCLFKFRIGLGHLVSCPSASRSARAREDDDEGENGGVLPANEEAERENDGRGEGAGCRARRSCGQDE